MIAKIIKEKDFETTLGLKKASDLVTADCEVPVFPKSAVLRSGDSEIREEAAALLREAKEKAERVKARIDEILRKAEEVYSQEEKRGLEEGRQEGLAKVTGLMTKAHAAHERILSQSEEEIVTLVRAITEKVIAREVKKGAVVDVVKQAVSQIVGSQIVVRVNPEDLHFLREKEKDLMALVDQSQTLIFREDPLIANGGCVVDSELGTIDAQLPNQIAAIKKSLGL